MQPEASPDDHRCAIARIAVRLGRNYVALDDLADEAEGFDQERLALAVTEVDRAHELATPPLPMRAAIQAASAPGAGRGGRTCPEMPLSQTPISASQVRAPPKWAQTCAASAVRPAISLAITARQEETSPHDSMPSEMSFTASSAVHGSPPSLSALAEPSMRLDMRRPADVLIGQALEPAGPDTGPRDSRTSTRLAKVINRGHATAATDVPLAALEADLDAALAHETTALCCAQRGIMYGSLLINCGIAL